MKSWMIISLSLLMSACQTTPLSFSTSLSQPKQISSHSACVGKTDLPAVLQGRVVEVSDEALLQQTIGETDEGKLCQAKVYQVSANNSLTLYRAWNSTNPKSRLGHWWALGKPQGRIADYRRDYEICYQWSALDKLSQCRLKAGSKLVIGTGQSARCSNYLRYPVSASKQIYLANAAEILEQCQDFDALFRWRAVKP